MSFDLYTASIPVFIRALSNLRGLLQKGEAHAAAHGFDPQILVNARLYPDMLPLTGQVYVAAEIAKLAAARLAGIDAPDLGENDSSFAEFYARIDNTIAFLNALRPEQLRGAEDRMVTYQIPGQLLEFTGSSFLLTFVLPNVFFHVATAHDLLRHNGVNIGKSDYLGLV